MISRRTGPGFALALAASVAACGGGEADSPDAGRFLDAGPDDFHVERAGYVNLIEGGAFLSVYALLQDGSELPLPTAIAQAGDCTVYQRPRPALCDPPCDGVCTATAVCTPYRANVDVGTITATGLAQPLRFVLGEFGYEPTPAPSSELFADDAMITVAAPGSAMAGFSVALRGVPALTGAPSSLTLVDDADAEVTWDGAGAGRIQLALVVGWHGAPYEAMMLCETADDGALTIPAALGSALPRASSSLESHFSTATRFRRASVVGPHGPIEIVVGSQTTLSFFH